MSEIKISPSVDKKLQRDSRSATALQSIEKNSYAPLFRIIIKLKNKKRFYKKTRHEFIIYAYFTVFDENNQEINIWNPRKLIEI